MTAPAQADPLAALQAATWGNEAFAERHCAENPHQMQLDIDGSLLLFVLYLSADGLEYCLTPRACERRLFPFPYRHCAGPALS